MEIQYQVKRHEEKIGNFTLMIECLRDLNQTIDDVFRYLEKEGNPQALEELCPYFGVIWPAARGLAQCLSELEEKNIQGKRVLELGCGLAIPSMIAAKKGAQVLATDFHPMVPGFLKVNLELNRLQNFEYLAVNWEKENPQLSLFDWVMGSDILYESRYAAPLAKTISTKIAPHGKVLIADPGRPYLQGFVDEMKKLGFGCETKIFKVPHPPKEQEVFVLILSRP